MTFEDQMKMNRLWWAAFGFGVLFTNLAFAGEPPRLKAVPKAAMTAAKDDGQPRYTQTYFYPPISQHEHFRNWSQVKRWMEAYNGVLDRPAAADAIVASLLEDQQQDELYTRLMALGYCFEQRNKMNVGGEVFDKLRARDDLASMILAADLLLKTVMGTGNDRDGNKVLAALPDDLCERAAGLLEYPDPVVQAIAEWMLSLRFKKQNRMTDRISELFSSADRQEPWFRKWWSRKAECHLDDDYCRQLLQSNRHGTSQSWTVEVDKLEDRMARRLAAPSSNAEQAVQQQVAFRDALKAIRAAIATSDLLAAHRSHPALRRAVRPRASP
jgi:hypothetical protein